VATLDEPAAVRRLTDRLGFGAGQLDVAAGFTKTAAALLNPPPDATQTPEPDLGQEIARPGKAAAGTAARKQATQAVAKQELTLATWWLDRMVATTTPLVERMTWFWHGHFATSEQKVRGPRLMQRQNDTFRQQGMADFGVLARSMIVDPAMMVWLDAQQNSVRAPNENLARESMELFLLGIGHYTEDDVKAAARALTGWTVDRDTITARLVPRRHDDTAKTILDSTQNYDAESFVNLVLSQAASPRFVAGRIWFRLVSATPPAPDVLDRLVAAYGAGRDIHALLVALVAEPAFVDSANSLVKQPVEWLVGLLRSLGLRPDQWPATALLAGLRNLGQVPFEPPNVGGWPADVAWLTTSAALARLHLAQAVAARADVSMITTVSAQARPEAARRLLGVESWTDRTTAALGKVADDPRQVLAIAACAPEYVVSR
jgi:uncharacterized protein (DUF1800 family)